MGDISLRRYTNLAATIHMLRSETITLLSPALWPDRNDAFYMAEYKRRTKSKCLVAFCMADASETFHHWQVFSPGNNGVCVVFKKDRLQSQVPKAAGFRFGRVNYKSIEEIEAVPPQTKDLPFMKRWPYADETEFRLIYSSKDVEADTFAVDIELDCIEKIYLSPWMPDPLAQSVRATLKELMGKDKVPVIRSTLLENERWKSAVTEQPVDQ